MKQYKYAQCRTFGHAWRPTTVDKLLCKREPVYVQHLECRTCGTEKSVRIDNRGQIEGASYLYPAGYQLRGRNTAKRNAQMRRLYLDGLQ